MAVQVGDIVELYCWQTDPGEKLYIIPPEERLVGVVNEEKETSYEVSFPVDPWPDGADPTPADMGFDFWPKDEVRVLAVKSCDTCRELLYEVTDDEWRHFNIAHNDAC